MVLQTLVRAVSNFLMPVMLFAFMQVACAANTLRTPGTYSSLVYNKEGGDLTGYEVRIVPTNSGVKAIVQVAEGDAGKIYIMDFNESPNGVSFEIPLASGVLAKFSGRVTNKGLEGTVSYPSGASEIVLLRRSISYWER